MALANLTPSVVTTSFPSREPIISTRAVFKAGTKGVGIDPPSLEN
jgi:hypothetical protein